jgi:hypothetical protein
VRRAVAAARAKNVALRVARVTKVASSVTTWGQNGGVEELRHEGDEEDYAFRVEGGDGVGVSEHPAGADWGTSPAGSVLSGARQIIIRTGDVDILYPMGYITGWSKPSP